MGKRAQWRTIGLAGVAYLILVGLMTLPAFFHLSQKVAGNNIDNWIFYWNDWWLRTAVANGDSWFYTPYLFYPAGTSLVTHSTSFLNSLLTYPLAPLVGPVAAYNLVFLGGLWVGAMGTFLLVREITGQPLAAFLAGFIFAFAPYHLTQALAHAHLGSIHWWPFYLLFLRRLLQNGRWRDAAAVGFFAACTLWSGLQLPLLLGLWTIPYLAWFLWPKRGDQKIDKRPLIWGLGAAGLLALLLGAPLLWPIAKSLLQTAAAAPFFTEGLSKQTDLLAYWIPPTYHPWWGEQMVPFYEKFVANRATMPYLGYSVLGLALLAVWKQGAKARFWAASALLWVLLAAGAAPRINGVVYEQIPLPYGWIETLFPISLIRAPDRFNLLVVLSTAVLAGIGAAYVERQKRGRWLLLPLGLLAVVEYLVVPLPMWELPPSSPFLEEMAQEEAMYGLIDYPMGYTISKIWLYYQTVHEKPLVEGHMSRYSAATYRFIATHPILQALYQTAERPAYLPPDTFPSPPLPLPALGPALRELQKNNLRYILLHPPYADEAQQAHFEEVLPLLPIYQDEAVVAYDLAHPRPWQYGMEPLALASAQQLIQATARVEKTASTLQITLLTRLDGNNGSPLSCHVRLVDSSASSTNELLAETAVVLFPGPTTWQDSDLSLQEVELPLPSPLPLGQYRWQLQCPQASYTSPDSLFVDETGQWALWRHHPNVVYGDDIQLAGIRWWTRGSRLHLALRWKALAAPGQAYKLFVHLLDETGAIVQQYDAVPCNWQCPTTAWRKGEVIDDEAILPLWGLSEGKYRLALGLYESQTGQRLAAQKAGNVTVPDSYYILPDEFAVLAP